MKEFGLLSADATVDDAEKLGAPKIIPFADMSHIEESKVTQFEDILKDMGLDQDVADILGGDSEEEETKMIDTTQGGNKKEPGFVKITSALGKQTRSNAEKNFVEDDDAGVDEKLTEEFKEQIRIA